MAYALVLGGGGVAAIGWETGLLKGLRDAGADISAADLIVGTSAGSVVGAQIATDCDLDDLYARQLQPPDPAFERLPAVGVAALGRVLAPFLRGGPMTQETLARIGALALQAATEDESGRLATIRARLPIHTWPDRRLLITGVDAASGAFVTWDRASDVPLPLAVAASCAVPVLYPPITIHGRRYIDGGTRSSTNADLARDCSMVFIIAPMPGTMGEVPALRSQGSRVELILPDAATLAAMGANPFDPVRRSSWPRPGGIVRRGR